MEFAGTIFGLIYVWYSIRQSLYTWPAGIMTSLIYCLVFFDAKFYAGMGLQIYYLAVSCYGWWSWSRGLNNDSSGDKLIVSRTSARLWTILFLLNLAITAFLYFSLRIYTDSPIPFGDSVTTSFSILATWMLARKKVEHWIIWIFVDLVSASLYLYRGLYFTAFLFLVYTVMAVVGYYEWQKEPEKVPC